MASDKELVDFVVDQMGDAVRLGTGLKGVISRATVSGSGGGFGLRPAGLRRAV